MITPELIKQVEAKLKTSRATYEHFFNNINDPAWVGPLLNAGYFMQPEEPVKEGEYITFPIWPESRYLLRVADQVQDEVTVILRALAESEINNPQVLNDFVQILLKIDLRKSEPFVDKVVKFLDIPYSHRLHEYVTDFAIKLIEAGRIKPGLKLVRSLLELKPDPKLAELDKDELQYMIIEPQMRYRDYDYKEILEKVTPILTSKSPVEAIGLYSGLLNDAINFKLLQYTEANIDDDQGDLEDYSNIWRPDIGVGRDYRGQPRHGLVSALRDSLTALMNSTLDDAEKLSILKSEVTEHKYKVYSRIVEYILRDYKDVDTFKIFYQGLFDTLKPITDPKLLNQELGGDFRPHSEITYAELANLSDQGLIDRLKTYIPKETIFSHDAVAENISTLIKNSPERYIKLSGQFAELKNQYVESLLSAAAEKADDLSEDDLAGAIELGGKLLKRVPEENERDRRYFEWAKTSFARLLNKVLGQRLGKTEYISERSIAPVMSSLLILARDPDPTPEHEKEYGGDNMDPATLAINTIRGEAMHALARAILWNARNKPKEDLLKKIYAELEWHLRLENDPALAIRTVYGQWLPWIWDSNKPWAEKNLSRIFSNDSYGDAAWAGYVTLNVAYNNILELIEPVMRQQIERLKTKGKTKNRTEDANTQLAQHIMVYYYRGLIDLSDGSIVRLFFDTASVEYRSEALRFVGFDLKKASEVPEEVIGRLMKLWEYRLTELSNHPEKGTAELEEFGSWFASTIFDAEWSLTNLLKVLAITHNAEPDFMVLEKLMAFSAQYPLESIKALKEMIVGARERWSIGSWHDEAETIIKAAYESSKEEAKKLAVEQANYLVTKGYPEYRNILK